MESQTALVGTDGVVELHAIARIDLYLAQIIDPGHLKGKLTIRFNDALSDLVRLELGVLIVGLLHGGQYLAHGLQILAFARMTLLELQHQFLHVHSCKF